MTQALAHLARLAAECTTATHERLDAIVRAANLTPSFYERKHYRSRTGRRTAVHQAILRTIKRQEDAIARRAEMDAFVGPMTPAQRNGHPF